jgi:hypothetical protein
MLVNLFESGGILTFEADLLPHVLGCVCSLDGFNVQVAAALFFFDCGVATVG